MISTSTLPFAKFSRKDWYCGKVLVATKVPEQTFQFKVYANSCTSTSIAAKTAPQYLSFRENFANGSVPVWVWMLCFFCFFWLI